MMTRATKSETKIHVGDVIEVTGEWKSDTNDILADNFKVIQSWTDTSDQPFKPIPPTFSRELSKRKPEEEYLKEYNSW